MGKGGGGGGGGVCVCVCVCRGVWKREVMVVVVGREGGKNGCFCLGV